MRTYIFTLSTMGENTYGNTTSQPASQQDEGAEEGEIFRLGITESGLKLQGMRNGYIK